MTLVNHEKLSDCQNLMCNEGKVSNWGEGKKGEGLGRVSYLLFSLVHFPPSPPPSSFPLLSPFPSLCACDQIFKRPILLITVVWHFHAIKICFTCDCAGQDRIIRSGAFHKLQHTIHHSKKLQFSSLFKHDHIKFQVIQT